MSAPSTPDGIAKKNRVAHDHLNEQEPIPEFLQRNNALFDQMITRHTMSNTTSIPLEDLRQLAILKHKIAIANTENETWKFYLKLGIGQWQTLESVRTNVDRCFWAMPVKTAASALLISTCMDTHKLYEYTANEYLAKLDRSIEQYRTEVVHIKDSLMNLPAGLEKAIDRFVQYHAIEPLHIKVNDKRAMLECDYHAQLLEREYQRLHPTDDQVRWPVQTM